jgi:uncharacterized protein (DUF2141 family)
MNISLMKSMLLLGIMLCVAPSMFAQERLQVEVVNIKNNSGSIRVGLFDNEKDFLKKAVLGESVLANGEKVNVVFENIPAGEYAISVIHDENDNEELDVNFLGIPKEGFGFGNDAKGSFGPPSFEKARVKIGEVVVKQVITLRYF